MLADDHPGLLEEMIDLLTPEFEVVRSVNQGAALIDAAKELLPDIVVSDISMPGLNGIDAGRQILQQGTCHAVIMLTAYNDPQLVRRAMAAGVRGFILKVDAGEELTTAIRSVLAGQTYFSRGVALTPFA